ncbi:MAG: prepilin-type N-terminal cleavage/methylation domain-containing protein [Fusobacterium sp.]|nr:prepilin-type N-terminal cleavage/methylation domain-containing protein [Fusobacterium sp.]
MKKTNSVSAQNASVRSAFTMAEILLSLTIIGVVAAITLPSLTGNINERTWNTQRKALYARMSQAVALMPALNGFGTVTEGTDASGSTIVTEDNAAETFITSGLSKVLKINNICDNTHLSDCGLASQYTDMLGSKKDTPKTLYELSSYFNLSFNETGGQSKSYHQANTKAAAFETANGESVLVFYNPYCQSELGKGHLDDYAQDKMCANFIFDLNGSKGPNTVGKDIGIMSIIYPTDSVVVAPTPVHKISGTYTQQQASQTCRNKDDESRLPNEQEFMSLFYNTKFVGRLGDSSFYWTSTLTDSNYAKAFDMTKGRIYTYTRDKEIAVQCVKR